MQYEGKIIYIGDVETVGQNGLQKRTFVLEEITDREFKGSIAVDLIKDKTALIDNYNVGDVVKVSLNSRANLAQTSGRYYNSITAWRIEGGNAASSSQNDDLPF